MSNYKSYFLKSLGLREDSILSDGTIKANDDSLDDQLKAGIKTENAHTEDDDLAQKIAKKHLNEDPSYYSSLAEANGSDDDSDRPAFSKLAPKVRCPQVIGVAVRGTKTGLLPAGGIVEDPERARLGGFELVQNKKPNSQGAIQNTPASSEIKADGGHYTPDNKEISKGKGPETSKKGEDSTHPFQTQQLGNKPFEDDGTTRDGESTPASAGGNGGDGRCNNAKSSASTASDRQDYKSDSSEPKEKKKGPWGIEIDEPESDESDIDDEDDVEIDIKEKEEKKEEKPKEKEEKKEEKPEEKKNLQERFQKLANISTSKNTRI